MKMLATKVERTALLAAFISFLTILASIALVIGVANKIVIPYNEAAFLGPTRFQVGLMYYNVTQTGLLLVVLLQVLYSDKMSGRPVSKLFPAVVIQSVSLFILLVLISITYTDYVLHGPRLQWLWIRDPEVRTFSTCAHLGVVIGFGWFMVITLRGKMWSKSSVLFLMAFNASVTFAFYTLMLQLVNYP